MRETGRDSRSRQLVEMSARRSGIPVTWHSAYRADRERLELHFEHLHGWTQGMKVVWTLTPTRDGTRVEIVHDLKFRVPLLAWFVEPIIDRVFISHIANKTLRTFKGILEG